MPPSPKHTMDTHPHHAVVLVSGVLPRLGADVLSKGVSSSGVKEPPVVGEADFEALDRLKVNRVEILCVVS